MKKIPRHQRPARLGRFLFGVPYYPEHWTDKEIERDPALMAEAGVNVVRMAEFAWDRMEPRPSDYDFSFFDEAIRRLANVGIQTILCTPTATPPRWLTEQNPEWLRQDKDGRRMVHGSRQHCCTTHPGFREASRRMTGAMAKHFVGNPHVIGWQTDNELYCRFNECYCPACAESFRSWLQKKYGTISTLNAAWGTAFWSQTYDNFKQIQPPLIDRPGHPNPGQHLDYFRFLSDAVIDFQRGQVELLRTANPGWWITHNGLFDHIDYWKFTEDLDFLGIDVYPGFATRHQDGFVRVTMNLEECRAASGSFIVPEQQAGSGGQRPYLHKNPQPGQMRLWTWQSVAHGADGILHFRWRTCRFGAEIYWGGVLDHDNIPRRRYRELAQEGAEFKRLGDQILGTVEMVRAAVLVETEQKEAHATMPLGLPGPHQQAKLAFAEIMQRHLPAGLVDVRDDFDGLEMIVLPSFPLMDEGLAKKLQSYVEGGGTLVVTARSATRNRANQVFDHTPPGFLSALFGVTVEEFGKLEPGEMTIQSTGKTIPAGEGYEILDPFDAEVLARWSGSALHAATGKPAVTIRRFGQGHALYLGSWFSEENVGSLFDLILSQCPVVPLAQADRSVEITCRHAHDRRLVFVLNHDDAEKIVTGLPCGLDLLANRKCEGRLELAPLGVAMIRCAGSAEIKP